MRIVFSPSDKYNITDICAYLKQYESDIIRNDNKTMLPFCADIALKRLFLYDMCANAFDRYDVKRDDIITDIENHISNGRSTENSENTFRKMLRKIKGTKLG